MSTRKSKGTTFAVMFRHSDPNPLLNEEDTAQAKALGLKYIVAQRLSTSSTIRVKLVGHRRPQLIDVHDADNGIDAFVRAVHAALDTVRQEAFVSIAPTSVKEALA